MAIVVFFRGGFLNFGKERERGGLFGVALLIFFLELLKEENRFNTFPIFWEVEDVIMIWHHFLFEFGIWKRCRWWGYLILGLSNRNTLQRVKARPKDFELWKLTKKRELGINKKCSNFGDIVWFSALAKSKEGH